MLLLEQVRVDSGDKQGNLEGTAGSLCPLPSQQLHPEPCLVLQELGAEQRPREETGNVFLWDYTKTSYKKAHHWLEALGSVYSFTKGFQREDGGVERLSSVSQTFKNSSIFVVSIPLV